jgi:hypothetical protein
VSIRGLISWHIFVGIALIGPALLKSASTLFRFVHYYRGDSAYVRKGPPHPILRISGPFVMLTTVAVLGTGVGLLIVHPGEGGLMLTAHKASFILWIGLMSIHVLGHIFEAVTASWRDLRPEPGDPAARRRFVRTGAVLASLVIGVGAAAVVTPTATAWTHRHFRSEEGRG